MKKTAKKEGEPKEARFKVVLDLRTTITVKGRERLEMWLERYPKAKVTPL